ncbi:MAG: D-arabinono-1,4-lactone oxidase [Polyangiaceae bacterium]
MARPRTFTNWSRVFRSTPREWHAPSSETELLELFDRARRENLRLKVVGTGHSWSDIAVPDELAVDLGAMRGVIACEGESLTVLGGTRLFEITQALDARGLAMPILGSIAEQTIAGAIGTGTHGSSLAHGNLASLVTALRLVTPTGEVLDLDGADSRLAAARVHLGALGVVTRVTLRVTPAFNLRERREPMPIGAVIKELDGLARSAEYVKLWWLPSTGKAVVFRYERTTEPASFSRALHFLDEVIVNRTLFEGILRAARRVPSVTASVNALVASTYLGASSVVRRSDRAFNLAMPPIHREAEWAIPLARTPAALEDLAAVIERLGLRVNFPCELRFVPRDDAWMSPAYGEDVCHVGVYQAENPDLRRYFDEAERIAARHGGRPHWGKESSWRRAELFARYPKADDFEALARALDPDAILENAFLSRVLGPRRHARR